MAFQFQVFDGVNSAELRTIKEFDMHCPLMAKGDHDKSNNFWQQMCDYRQTLKDNKRTCYGGCKMQSESDVKRGKHQHLSIPEIVKLGKDWHKQLMNGVKTNHISIDSGYSISTVNRYVATYCLANDLPVPIRQGNNYGKQAVTWLKDKAANKLSNKELAIKYGVSVSTITKYVAIHRRASC